MILGAFQQLKRIHDERLTISNILAYRSRVSFFFGDLILRVIELPQQFSQSVRQTLVGSILTPQPGAYAGAHNVKIETVF